MKGSPVCTQDQNQACGSHGDAFLSDVCTNACSERWANESRDRSPGPLQAEQFWEKKLTSIILERRVERRVWSFPDCEIISPKAKGKKTVYSAERVKKALGSALESALQRGEVKLCNVISQGDSAILPRPPISTTRIHAWTSSTYPVPDLLSQTSSTCRAGPSCSPRKRERAEDFPHLDSARPGMHV